MAASWMLLLLDVNGPSIVLKVNMN